LPIFLRWIDGYISGQFSLSWSPWY